MMTKQAELKQQAYASNLKSRALSVLIYLIDRSNKDLTCYPAIPTIAVQLHISISTVKRALNELVEAGYIEKTARYRERNHGQSSNLYTLLFVEHNLKPENNISPAVADRDHIDTFTVQESSKSDAVKYITFYMLAENSKMAIQKPSNKETTKDEKDFYCFADRSAAPALYTPAQVSILLKRIKLKGLPDRNVKEGILTLCRFPYYRWTGAGSIFRPP